MAMSSHRESAQIIPFVPRARAGGQSRGQTVPVPEPRPSLPTVEYGSGWYHEAAIQEADRTRRQ